MPTTVNNEVDCWDGIQKIKIDGIEETMAVPSPEHGGSCSFDSFGWKRLLLKSQIFQSKLDCRPISVAYL
jgi:hypothetical protein